MMSVTRISVVAALMLVSSPDHASAADGDTALNLLYTGEAWTVASGGIDSGSRYMHNVNLTLETEIGGGTLFLYGLHNNASTFSDELVGDAQVISNIDAEEHFKLYEAWYDFSIGEGMSIKAGLIDLNSEFDDTETAGLFLNSSHGIGPDFSQAGENGPSIFPSTSLAVRFQAELDDNWMVRLGVFDAVPNDPDDASRMKFSLGEGALLVGEVDYVNESGLHVGLGVWNYTSKFVPLEAGPRVGGNRGVYAMVEGPVGEDLSAWVRVGMADTDINQMSSYVGGGLVLNRPFRERQEDQVGIAFGYAINGGTFKDVTRMAGDMPNNGELNIEVSYLAQLTDMIAIQPDIQYVINPGAVEGVDDALVVGVRFVFGLSF